MVPGSVHRQRTLTATRQTNNRHTEPTSFCIMSSPPMSVSKRKLNRDYEKLTEHSSPDSRSAKISKRPKKYNPMVNDFLRLQTYLYQQCEKACWNAFQDTLTRGDSTDIGAIFEARRFMEAAQAKYSPYIGNISLTGSNDGNQMGLAKLEGVETNKMAKFPQALDGLDMVHVEAGPLSNYCLTRHGELYSFGSSDKGVLGRVTNVNEDPDVERKLVRLTGFNPSKHAIVSDPSSSSLENEDSFLTAVKGGGSHGIALSATGRVYVFGCYLTAENDEYREMPPPDFPDHDNHNELYKGAAPKGFREEARHVYMMPQPVKQIAAGLAMSAAVLQDGTLVTWGIDSSGELGRGISETLLTQVKEYKTLDYGKKKEVLETIKSTLLTPKSVVYDPPIGKHTVMDVACGSYHMLVVVRKEGQSDTMVYSTGLNQYGQLGLGDQKNRNVLTLIPASVGKHIVKVAAGQFHSMFLDITGLAIWTCGRSDSCQLGITEVTTPGSFEMTLQQLAYDQNDDPKDLDFHSIAAGENHCIAVSRSGKLFTWGFGESGQLGLGDCMDEPRPTMVPMDDFVLEASGGAQHTIVLTTNDYA